MAGGRADGPFRSHVGRLRTDEMPLWALVTGKLASTAYHEESASDARRRIAASFETHLKGAA